MDKNNEVSGQEFLPTADFALQDWPWPHVGTGNPAEWQYFESLFYFTKKDFHFFTLCLGQGSRRKEQYGSLSHFSRQIPTEESIIEIMECGWRGLHCRYWHDSVFRQLRVQISGEIANPYCRSHDRTSWKEAILLKSVVALHYPQIASLVEQYIPNDKPLDFAPK